MLGHAISVAATWALGAWAAVACAFTLGALAGASRLLADARRRRAPAVWPAIAVLRPCEGDEPGLAENLASSATARYAGPRRVYLLVPSVSDASHTAAVRARELAQARAPSVPVELVVTDVDTPHNRKVAQLAVAAARIDREAPAVEALVTVDSDVRLDEDALAAAVTALFEGDDVLAVSAPPVEVVATPDEMPPGRRATLADRLSTTLLSSTAGSFLALSGLAHVGGGVPQVGGALVAMRRRVVPLLDGYRALEPLLGEDFELTMRVYRAGGRVATANTIARCREGGRSLGQVIRRFARWALVVRRQRPLLFPTYFLLLGATPLVLLTVAAAVALGAPHARLLVAAAATLLALRVALAMRLRRAFALAWDPIRSAAAMLVGELLLDVAAALAWVSTEIEWRGRRFTVARGGRLEPPKR